jgi:hypothetical protein
MEWKTLGGPEEIQELMRLFGDFHDSCVREIHVETKHYVDEKLWMHMDGQTIVRMLVQRQFRDLSAIELRFEEVVALHVAPPPPNYDAVIFSASFFVRDDVFYWAESARWEPNSAVHREVTWIAARKVSWRDASEWMGPDLRYAQKSS